jgi:hypothetical protein
VAHTFFDGLLPTVPDIQAFHMNFSVRATTNTRTYSPA